MTCDSASFSTVFQSGQWVDDNERQCAMEPHLQRKTYQPLAGLKSGITRPVGQHLTY